MDKKTIPIGSWSAGDLANFMITRIFGPAPAEYWVQPEEGPPYRLFAYRPTGINYDVRYFNWWLHIELPGGRIYVRSQTHPLRGRDEYVMTFRSLEELVSFLLRGVDRAYVRMHADHARRRPAA